MSSRNASDSYTRLLHFPDSLLTCLVQAISTKRPASYEHGLICRKLRDISPSAQLAAHVNRGSSYEPVLSELNRFVNLSRVSFYESHSLSDFQDLLNAAPSWKHLHAFEASFLPFPPELPHKPLTTFFEACRGLKSLQLAGLLGDIPPSISSLERLEDLSLSLVRSLPDNIGDLKQLRSFKFQSRESDVLLPSSLTSLSALESLKLDCNVTHLPEAIGELVRLTSLEISSEVLASLPQSIGALTRLRELRFPCCASLESLPDEVRKISSLRALDIPSVRDLELLRNLPRLTVLRIIPDHPENSNAEEIPAAIGELQCLKSLELTGFRLMQRLPQQLSGLKHLTKLRISECHLVQVDSITGLCSLKNLHISVCWSLETLPEDLLQRCTALRDLRLSQLPALSKLPEGIQESNRLRSSFFRVAAVKNSP